MTTYTEVLPATTSSPARAITWEPSHVAGRGTLTISDRRCCCRYQLTELPTEWEGRSVRFEKAEGQTGTDREEESYDVFIHRGGQDRRCCCKGFERHGHCKHIAAVIALLENGWLDLSLVNPEADAGPAEVEDQPEPEWAGWPCPVCGQPVTQESGVGVSQMCCTKGCADLYAFYLEVAANHPTPAEVPL